MSLVTLCDLLKQDEETRQWTASWQTEAPSNKSELTARAVRVAEEALEADVASGDPEATSAANEKVEDLRLELEVEIQIQNGAADMQKSTCRFRDP